MVVTSVGGVATVAVIVSEVVIVIVVAAVAAVVRCVGGADAGGGGCRGGLGAGLTWLGLSDLSVGKFLKQTHEVRHH